MKTTILFGILLTLILIVSAGLVVDAMRDKPLEQTAKTLPSTDLFAGDYEAYLEACDGCGGQCGLPVSRASVLIGKSSRQNTGEVRPAVENTQD